MDDHQGGLSTFEKCKLQISDQEQVSQTQTTETLPILVFVALSSQMPQAWATQQRS
jgi:hypothetical protein